MDKLAEDWKDDMRRVYKTFLDEYLSNTSDALSVHLGQSSIAPLEREEATIVAAMYLMMFANTHDRQQDTTCGQPCSG